MLTVRGHLQDLRRLRVSVLVQPQPRVRHPEWQQRRLLGQVLERGTDLARVVRRQRVLVPVLQPLLVRQTVWQLLLVQVH
jgi:hypothetical protein